MEKIDWTDRVRNEEVLHRVKERNIVHTILRRKADWIVHILCRYCLLKHLVEGNVEGRIAAKRRRGRRRKHLLDDLKGAIGCCKLKEEILDGNVWGTQFGIGYEPDVR